MHAMIGNEDGDEDGADETADTMHTEDIQRVVVTELFLELGASDPADDGGGRANADGSNRADFASSWRNGSQSSNGTCGDA